MNNFSLKSLCETNTNFYHLRIVNLSVYFPFILGCFSPEQFIDRTIFEDQASTQCPIFLVVDHLYLSVFPVPCAALVVWLDSGIHHHVFMNMSRSKVLARGLEHASVLELKGETTKLISQPCGWLVLYLGLHRILYTSSEIKVKIS